MLPGESNEISSTQNNLGCVHIRASTTNATQLMWTLPRDYLLFFMPHISRIFQSCFKNICRTYQDGGAKTAIYQEIKFCAAVNNREQASPPWGTCLLGYFPLDFYPQNWYVELLEGGERFGTTEEEQKQNIIHAAVSRWRRQVSVLSLR